MPGFYGTTYAMSLLSVVYWVQEMTSPKKSKSGLFVLGMERAWEFKAFWNLQMVVNVGLPLSTDDILGML